MYQALYRKYRPKTLEDVCGQDTVVKIIKNSVKKNQINHAYLFAGPRGTGKTSIAKIFAKIVNCENLKDCIPCNKCVSCTTSNNSDIIEIDAASNNGVDEIRELRNKVNLVPSYGKYKIYIIDEVHMLTTGAFNALLKTLEEPPSHIIFILATTDPQKIPETILSRCQRFDFKKITDEAIVENLKKICKKEKIEITDSALEEIARLSDGGMRDSVGLLDQAKAYTDQEINIEDIHDINGTITEIDLSILLENIICGKLEEILKKIDEYNEKGKNFTKILEEFINYLRNLLLFKKVPEYFKKNFENTNAYQKTSEKIDVNTIFNFIEMLTKYEKEMKTSSNTKLIFELSLIRLSQSEHNNKQKQTNVYNIGVKEDKIPENKTENEKAQSKNNLSKVQKKEPAKETIQKEEKIPVPIEKNEELEELIDYIKKIRIDNTLSKFSKKTMMELKQVLQTKLNELLLNSDYSHSASMLLDGQLKAASPENMIFLYKTERIAHAFNENLIQLENTVEKALNKKYNLIATNLEEWETIKEEFNNKKRPFNYTVEDFDIQEVLKIETGDIISMFEDIIEYK